MTMNFIILLQHDEVLHVYPFPLKCLLHISYYTANRQHHSRSDSPSSHPGMSTSACCPHPLWLNPMSVGSSSSALPISIPV